MFERGSRGTTTVTSDCAVKGVSLSVYLVKRAKEGISQAGEYVGKAGAYFGDDGEAMGKVGEYFRDVGESCVGLMKRLNETHLHRGDAGLNDGLVGEYRGDVGLNDGDCGMYHGEVGENDGEMGEYRGLAAYGNVPGVTRKNPIRLGSALNPLHAVTWTMVLAGFQRTGRNLKTTPNPRLTFQVNFNATQMVIDIYIFKNIKYMLDTIRFKEPVILINTRTKDFVNITILHRVESEDGCEGWWWEERKKRGVTASRSGG
ncbi:hypothetical protein C8J57DRAFT_1247861 [Mycena rebaudengoi]|nr:hypothetical protein C8J57DRAFT_1247861 [Mycena rebaudengoi]